MDRRGFIETVAAAAGFAVMPDWARAQAVPAPATPAPPDGGWVRLVTEPYRGKQDDIVFVDRRTGWYGNGLGRVFRTRDGGDGWEKVTDKPGTFVRALGFVDRDVGVLGNIAPGSFPNVTDTVPLYRTTDGGVSWTPAAVPDGALVGVCAIDVQRVPFVNSGRLDHRPVIWAGGRVGGPGRLVVSRDLGESWSAVPLNDQTAMVLDVKFVSEHVGFLAGATDTAVDSSNALVLKTSDGGRTWRPVYRSARPWEITWKMAWPTPSFGVVTVQNYNPDPTQSQRVVAVTTDGGETWTERPLIDDHGFQAFGVGFLDERRGWVGGTGFGMETLDGGRSWAPVGLGRAVNKIRIVRDDTGVSVFAIGLGVSRLLP